MVMNVLGRMSATKRHVHELVSNCQRLSTSEVAMFFTEVACDQRSKFGVSFNGMKHATGLTDVMNRILEAKHRKTHIRLLIKELTERGVDALSIARLLMPLFHEVTVKSINSVRRRSRR